MRSLRTLLLVNLGLFTAAALLLVSLSAVVFADGDGAIGAAIALWYGAGALIVFLVFGAIVWRRGFTAEDRVLFRLRGGEAPTLPTGELPTP